MIDGCAVNNHWWLFGAAAGSSSYAVSATVWPTGGSLYLGSFSASNQPVLNLQLLACS